MSDPLVSCLTATYGRPILLGEAIKCFIDQDYPNKELIVLNDQEGVTLRLDNCPDNIHIYNYPKRFYSLGEKRNYLKALARGDYCCIWDDDDLYTPFRIRESVQYSLENPSFDIIKAKDAVISCDNKNYKIANNLFHSQAIVTKKYMSNKMYPNISIGEDAGFETGAKIKSVDMFPFFWYIYRWGLNTHHVSGINDGEKSWAKSLDYYKDIKGEILIKAEFQNDYWEHIKDYMNNINPSFGDLWYKKIKK